MIKKMTKYSFVIFHAEVDEFLAKLQSLGVVDITRSPRAIDVNSKEQFDSISHHDRLIKELTSLKPVEGEQIENIELDNALIVKEIESRLSFRDELKIALSEAKSELLYASPWGDFNEEDLNKLKRIGLNPHFYICQVKRYDKEWENKYPIHILNTRDDKIYFVILSENEETLEIPLNEVKFPSNSATSITNKINDLQDKEEQNNKMLLSLSKYIPHIESIKNDLKGKLDIYLAKSGSESGAEETITIFEGFAPVEDDEKIVEALEANGVYYIKEDAKAEDNPPIKLKNNFFSKLYEPIGELYMLPKYGENDLTAYFAPFYMLFFGLCLGDMGYGLVLLIAGIAVAWKIPKYKAYGKLIAWLGFGSIIMPALSGTFFGGKIYDFIPMTDNAKGMFFSDLKMFWFAIIFGLVQIIFARIIKVIFTIKDKGFVASLNEVGWIFLISWCAVAYASSEAGFSYPAIFTYICAWGGLALIIFFSSDSKNIFARFGKGVVSLYDITGVFGDMLSYIRLFGLGTAGGILGLVVNSVAMQMSSIPYLGWVLTIIMLLFGHTAVLLLSCLGAFVHPMRLTFVEFYKNAGFEGGGREYRPLKKD